MSVAVVHSKIEMEMHSVALQGDAALPPHSQLLFHCLAAPTSIMKSTTEAPPMHYTPLTSSFKPLHCISNSLVSPVLWVSRQLSPRGLSPKQKLPYRASSASNFQPLPTLKVLLLFYKARNSLSKKPIMHFTRRQKRKGNWFSTDRFLVPLR